ncbi:AlpA family phage regulatory protein [Minwuia sp. IMCC4030]|uniref:helix-turn-helix transcriptional regulator n=1 Tax=Minwuia sp. IMCC4030 TaxID=3040677 RepID=UPI0032B0743B
MKRVESDQGRSLRVIREAECKTKSGLSRAWRFKLERRGEFPRRVKLGRHAVGWLEHEVDDWIKACAGREVA